MQRPMMLLQVGVSFLCIAASGLARAQEPGASLFHSLFPQPSGQNGYEEFVQAGEMVESSKGLAQALQAEPKASLAAKRAAASDRLVTSAIARLRQGLAKPVRYPYASPGESMGRERELFRKLIQTLQIDHYVALADDRVGAALDDLGTALAFDTLLHLLTPEFIYEDMTKGIVEQQLRHVPQLGERDCAHLIRLAKDWLQSPDPGLSLLMWQKRAALESLTTERDSPRFDQSSKRDMFVADLDTRTGNRDLVNEVSSAFRESGARRRFLDEMIDRTTTWYDAAIASYQKPPWERTLPRPGSEDTLAGKVMGAYGDDLFLGLLAYHAEQRARVQLLAVHAAVILYRWESGRVPETLKETRAGTLAIDPLTGYPFEYRRLDDHEYELKCNGLDTKPKT